MVENIESLRVQFHDRDERSDRGVRRFHVSSPGRNKRNAVRPIRSYNRTREGLLKQEVQESPGSVRLFRLRRTSHDEAVGPTQERYVDQQSYQGCAS